MTDSLLLSMLTSLDDKELGEFRKYLEYNGKSKNRKDIQLLELVLQHDDENSDLIVQELYDVDAEEAKSAKLKNTFYQWRKILLTHLEDFCTQRLYDDKYGMGYFKYYLLGKFLFERKKYRAALKYTKKAEQFGEKTDDFNLLDRVYMLQLDYAYILQDSIDVPELLEKVQKNDELRILENKTLLKYNVLNHEVHKFKQSGEKPDYASLLDKAKEDFYTNDYIKVNAKAFYRLTITIYNFLVEDQEQPMALDHLREAYGFMMERQMFTGKSDLRRINLLTLMVRTSVLNRKLELAESYLVELNNIPSSFVDDPQLNLRIHMIDYVFNSLKGNLHEAGEKLYEIAALPKVQRLVKEDLFSLLMLQANLVSYNFMIGEYKEAKKYLNQLLVEEKKMRVNLGLEPAVFGFVVELMVYFDTKNVELFNSKFTSFKRRFSSYFDNENIGKYFEAIKIMRSIVMNDFEINDDIKLCMQEFLRKDDKNVLASSEFLPLNPYIKSLYKGSSYYQEMLLRYA